MDAEDYRAWLDIELQLLALEVLTLELPLGLLRAARAADADADPAAVAAAVWTGCARLAQCAAGLLERPLGLLARLGLELPDGYADALTALDRLEWKPPADVAAAVAPLRPVLDGPAGNAGPADRAEELAAMLRRMRTDREQD